MNAASNVSADVGLELFRSLSAITSRSDNIFISTYGIVSALSMLLLGTKEGSEKELSSFFGIKKNGLENYHQGYVEMEIVMHIADPFLATDSVEPIILFHLVSPA